MNVVIRHLTNTVEIHFHARGSVSCLILFTIVNATFKGGMGNFSS